MTGPLRPRLPCPVCGRRVAILGDWPDQWWATHLHPQSGDPCDQSQVYVTSDPEHAREQVYGDPYGLPFDS